MIKKAKTRIITIITALVMIFSVGMVFPDVTKAENTFDQNIATNGLNYEEITGDNATVFTIFLSDAATDQTHPENRGDGFQGRWKMLTQSQLDSLNETVGIRAIFGNQSTRQWLNSEMINYSLITAQGEYVDDTVDVGKGLYLETIAYAMGYKPDNDSKTRITAIGADGTKTDAGSKAFIERYYYTQDNNNPGVPVFEILKLNGASSLPSFRMGQENPTDKNKWKDNIKGIQIDAVTTATQKRDVVYTVRSGSTISEYVMNDIVDAGEYKAKYYYYDGNSDEITADVKGVPLTNVLSQKGIVIGRNDAVSAENSAGALKELSAGDISKYFLAYSGTEKTAETETALESHSEFCLFGPGETIAEVKFNDIYGIKLTKAPQSPQIAASSKGYRSIKISWDIKADAKGYEVFNITENKKIYVSGGTKTYYVQDGLKTGKKYTYKVRAYNLKENESKVFGDYSSSKATVPVPGKPSSIKLYKKSKAVKVKWSRVKGASGYQVYMAAKKNGKYKNVKNIKSAKTTVYTKTKLKKGKKYYFKVRAYKTVGKNKIKGKWSAVKYKKL